MPDTYDAVMAGCRLLMERMSISKVELAQFLRSVADVLELEAIYTDPPLATADPERSAKRRQLDEVRMRRAADALFAATPEQLGQAALEQARLDSERDDETSSS